MVITFTMHLPSNRQLYTKCKKKDFVEFCTYLNGIQRIKNRSYSMHTFYN